MKTRLLLLITLTATSWAQDKPLASPHAVLTQTVGLTDITIEYHRPAVKGRKVWGGLVPFGEVWRTGANQNTTITFSKDVKIEGKTLKAGTYGFHTIPGESEWTVIFSSDSKSWGSFSYDQKKDVLRVKVKSEKSEFVERMRFTVDDMTDSSCSIVLQWANLKLAVSCQV